MIIEDENRPVGPRRTVAANDNGTAGTKIDAAVWRIAHLLGRQITREEFERRSAANDNRPALDAFETKFGLLKFSPRRILPELWVIFGHPDWAHR